jgi:predicted DNA-binding protein
MPAARRKITPNGVTEGDARISILLPKRIDRQLRALSASTGTSVSKIVRAWIVEKLREVDQDGRGTKTS